VSRTWHEASSKLLMYLESHWQILHWPFVILSAGAGGNGICLDCIAACDDRVYEALITITNFDYLNVNARAHESHTECNPWFIKLVR
jgi:hypothetical protein